MSKLLAVYRTEMRSDILFHLGWVLGIGSYLFLSVLIYPGDDTISSFAELLEEPYFQAFLGQLDLANPGYGLWLSLMIPFVVILYTIYYVLAGVRVAMKSIYDKTGELVHTFPMSRDQFLGVRAGVACTYVVVNNLVLFASISIPFMGEAIPIDRSLTILWWGILYGLMCLSFGMFMGIVTGGMGKGQQFGLILPLLFYAMQLLVNSQPDLSDLNRVNPLAWYEPSPVMLGQELPVESIVKIVLVLVIVGLCNIILFARKDLIIDTPINIPLFVGLFRKKKSLPEVNQLQPDTANNQQKVSSISSSKREGRSSKQNILVFWGRIFEKRLPFTADFLYSEGRVMLIAFLVVVLIWPLQLAVYPGDELIQQTVTGFGSEGIMKLFTYGHDLSEMPYLWFLATQTHGNHYFLFLPLTAHWVGKAIRKDAETMNGEIMGSLPVPTYQVVLQRFLAIVLEIIYLVMWMILFLIISEAITGKSLNLAWEIVSIIWLIPLYVFLISLSFTIILIFERPGLIFSRIMMITMLLLFFVGVMVEGLNDQVLIWVKGVFGLYDPIVMIKDQTLIANNGGEFILLALAVITTGILLITAKYYNWIDVKRDKAFDIIAN